MSEENIKIQTSRDNIIRNAMIERNFSNFPMDENYVGYLFPFFRQITHENPLLNIVLLYKLKGKESSCIIIRNNQIHMYHNKQEAMNSIMKIPTTSH